MMTLVVIFTITSGTIFVVQASTAPRAWIASYANGRTSGLRVSEMLEVRTSGFAPEAELEYEYSGLRCNTYYSPDTASYSYTYGDKRYFALSGSKSVKGKVTVKSLLAQVICKIPARPNNFNND